MDLRFMDYPGLWQHFSVPISELGESCFEDGFGFDGFCSSRLATDQRQRHAVIPDPTTANMDPFFAEPPLPNLQASSIR